MSQHHRITLDDLGDAMLGWVLFASQVGPNRHQQLKRKALHFCPATGEFKISADGRSAQLVQTRRAAVDAYNDVVIGRLK